jgi:hypothetical protein
MDEDINKMEPTIAVLVGSPLSTSTTQFVENFDFSCWRLLVADIDIFCPVQSKGSLDGQTWSQSVRFGLC